MALQTIENIRKLRDEIREQIKEIDYKAYKDQKFGPENEYSYAGLIGGVQNLLTDLSVLLKNENRFIKLSTYNERSKIYSSLANIKSYLDAPGNLYSYTDELKSFLRPFNLKYFEDRFIEFETEIESARRLKLLIEEDRKDASNEVQKFNEAANDINTAQEESKKRLENLKDQISDLEQKKESLLEEVESLSEKNAEILKIKNESEDLLESIKDLASESSSNEKLIKNFALNIQKSEERADIVNSKINDSYQKIEDYEKERTKILKDAETLIENARLALDYTTAQGISASFQTQYDLSNKWYQTITWLVGAAGFIGGIIYIGYVIIHGQNPTTNMLLGRILMVPILLVGLYFCLNQYTKQKNIVEDYAYKKVISQAIVGFSEQIKKHQSENSDEYVTYMKTALSEIHQDPLRKRGKTDNISSTSDEVDVEKTLDLFKKFMETYKNIPQ